MYKKQLSERYPDTHKALVETKSKTAQIMYLNNIIAMNADQQLVGICKGVLKEISTLE